MQPLVSVVMPCYNYASFVGDAVDSVLSQTYKNIELIIINDGSTDDTKEILEAITDSRVTVLHIENSGVSAARNKGIELAKGQFIAFIDADDLWSPDKIQLQVQAFKQHPDCSYCFTNFSRFDAENNHYGSFTDYAYYLGKISQNATSELRVHFKDVCHDLEMPWYPTINMVRMNKIKHLFERDRRIGEDVSFFMHFWASTDGIFVPKTLAFLRVHGANSSNISYSHAELLINVFSSKLKYYKQREFKKTLGRLYLNLAYQQRKRSQFSEAAKNYSRSILNNHFSFKAVAFAFILPSLSLVRGFYRKDAKPHNSEGNTK